ncbi:class I SAM-dependent methyltransferase [Phytomonospora sp. NPDC050363]|uniref:class I SAM-dependent methyltransferase n=1 Tax=Phytomonospora sp. NPDC050363 TaxID=3155642 RepID=UPI0033ECAFF3
MLDYDTEAAVYDATRGGPQRAEQAAAAIAGLIGEQGPVIDIGGGTGIVAAALTTPGRPVLVADASTGMLTAAHTRLPGRAVRADALALPFRDASVPAVICVWLLHLLPHATAEAVCAEAARVLAPGGVFATTVDKAAAHDTGSDLDIILRDLRRAAGADSRAADDHAHLGRHCAALGLTEAATTTFTGTGQGRTPATLIAHLRDGRRFAWMGDLPAEAVGAALAALAALPGQHTRRPDPRYTLASWTTRVGAPPLPPWPPSPDSTPGAPTPATRSPPGPPPRDTRLGERSGKRPPAARRAPPPRRTPWKTQPPTREQP